MAHMIENNMISWKGETPWHGLGVQVEPNMTGMEMLKSAKMDWQVQRRALAMRNAQGQGLLSDPLKNFRAIVRVDTDEVFQVASDRYFPVQNAQIIDFFRAYCEAGHATMEVVGGLKGGAIIWALAKLNGESDATIGKTDAMKGYMMLATSHDGSIQTVGQATNVRVVCWNTLSAAMSDRSSQFRLKHSAKWNVQRADDARRTMGMAIESIAQQNEVASKLSQVKIDQKGREQFVMRLLGGQDILTQAVANTTQDHQSMGAGLLDSIVAAHTANAQGADDKDLGRLGKAILDAIINSPGADLPTAKNTMWGAVNGVSYVVDHTRGRGQDTRLASAFFGDGDRLKRSAMNVAMDMAGVQATTPQGVYD